MCLLRTVFSSQFKSKVGHILTKSVTLLVATTTGSSAAGVELTTDDCRQPTGISDENSFFSFFFWKETFFGGQKLFFWNQKMSISTQKMELFSTYCSSVLISSSTSSTPVRPCTDPVQRLQSNCPKEPRSFSFPSWPSSEQGCQGEEQFFPQLVVSICSCVYCVSTLWCSTYAHMKRVDWRNACLTRIWSQFRVFDLRNDQLVWGRSALWRYHKDAKWFYHKDAKWLCCTIKMRSGQSVKIKWI